MYHKIARPCAAGARDVTRLKGSSVLHPSAPMLPFFVEGWLGSGTLTMHSISIRPAGLRWRRLDEAENRASRWRPSAALQRRGQGTELGLAREI